MSRRPSSWLAWILSWFGFGEFVAPEFAVSFAHVPGGPMSLVGTVTPKAADAKVPVVKRTVTVAVDAGTPITLDATSGAVTFTVEDGQTVVISMTDTSAGGVVSAPTTVTIVAHDSVTAPDAPAFDVSFAPAV